MHTYVRHLLLIGKLSLPCRVNPAWVDRIDLSPGKGKMTTTRERACAHHGGDTWHSNSSNDRYHLAGVKARHNQRRKSYVAISISRYVDTVWPEYG